MADEAGPREGSVRLRDGRTLAYAEWGDPDGWPVLGCHGSPSSRLERHVEDGGGQPGWGVRLIVPRPPGLRGPHPHPRPHTMHWTAAAPPLLAHLGARRLARPQPSARP